MDEQKDALQWRDKDGQSWSTRVDIPTAQRLRSGGFNFVDHEAFAQKLADPFDAADFAIALHRGQWESRGLQEVEFLELITAEVGTIEQVLEASIAGVTDFLLRNGDSKTAAILRKAWEASKAANIVAVNKLNSSLVDEAITSEINRAADQVDQTLQQMISGETSIASSESTGATQLASDSKSS